MPLRFRADFEMRFGRLGGKAPREKSTGLGKDFHPMGKEFPSEGIFPPL
jgi:hypothetical protein